MSQDSTRKARSRKAIGKPKKPYPDFPLSPHAGGKWQKKVNGKVHYFGRWGRMVNGKLERLPRDTWWKDALADYKARIEDVRAGRTPRVTGDALTVAMLCDAFLVAKKRKLTAGELGQRMFMEYHQTTDLLVETFGKTRLVDDLAADDFEALRAIMAERWGPVRLSNSITRVKSVFKYGIDNDLLDKAPRFGSEFKKPGKAVLRRHRAEAGEKMLEAGQLRKLIETAAAPFRAMILLGINAGFGNHDVATLPMSALDLDAGWVDFPRPKTGIDKRCPLWPETVAAIREALGARPAPKADQADAEIVFLQPSGRRWVRNTEKSRTDNVSVHFGELMKKLKIHRDGLNFYALRHVFRTVADAARDPVAIDLIMGHTDGSMAAHYRERIEDSRLQAVTEHVRAWLFGEAPGDDDAEEADHQEEGEGEVDAASDPADHDQEDDKDTPRLRLYAG